MKLKFKTKALGKKSKTRRITLNMPVIVTQQMDEMSREIEYGGNRSLFVKHLILDALRRRNRGLTR
jgi:hypothetical protein